MNDVQLRNIIIKEIKQQIDIFGPEAQLIIGHFDSLLNFPNDWWRNTKGSLKGIKDIALKTMMELNDDELNDPQYADLSGLFSEDDFQKVRNLKSGYDLTIIFGDYEKLIIIPYPENKNE